MALQNTSFSIGQSEVIVALPEDSNGNPGLLGSGNVPSWSINPNSPQSGITITPAANGLSATIAAQTPGSYQVDVKGQNSVGGQLTSSFTVTVVENPASQFGFTFGNPS